MTKPTLPRWILSSNTYEGMEEEIHRDLSAAFQQNILDRVPANSPLSEMAQKRVQAQANFEAMIASLNWEKVGDAYMIWALVNAENTGWWTDLGGSLEYESFQEFAEEVYQKANDKNARSSKSADWRFIVGYTEASGVKHRGLINILKDNGIPVNRSIALLSLESKWRASISRMRMIERQYRDDPDEGAKQIVKIVEEEILNPVVTVRDIREKAPGFGGTVLRYAPIRPEATAYVITTGKGGGLITIQVEETAQVTAIDYALRGIVEGEEAFFPRDYNALMRELHGLLVRKPYEVIYKPLSELRQKNQADEQHHLSVVIAIKIGDILDCNSEEYFETFLSERAVGWAAPILGMEVYGYFGRDELHLLLTLDVTALVTLL